MNTKTKLNASRLLGYRLLAACEERKGTHATADSSVRLGGKLGEKIGAKIGSKIGAKVGLKPAG